MKNIRTKPKALKGVLILPLKIVNEMSRIMFLVADDKNDSYMEITAHDEGITVYLSEIGKVLSEANSVDLSKSDAKKLAAFIIESL